MDYQQILQQLTALGQTQILQGWEFRTQQQKQHLLEQLSQIDWPLLQQQQNLINVSSSSHNSLEPFTTKAKAGNTADQRRGLELLSKGQVGCLIVAGGQGTRLQFDGPKGMFPVTPIRHKSLYQLFAEKTIAASKQAQRELPLAIMTSPQNHQATATFFKSSSRFGLSEKQLYFFQQQMLPLLDVKGNLFLEDKDSLAEGPDGNGGALQHFYRSGIWDEWHRSGIRYVNFILVDNPLADPFDAELFGYHERMQSEIVIKTIERSDPLENVGILAKEKGKTVVVEYSEMPEAIRMQTNANGSLSYPCANLSLFSFSMDFIQKMANKNPSLLHKAFKAARYLSPEGQSRQSEKPVAWKFERFIFDLLPEAESVEALLYPREDCFAPLKNASGKDSLQTVQEALERRDRKVLKYITGQSVPAASLEISQEFYYPTPELLSKWRGKTPSNQEYVDA